MTKRWIWASVFLAMSAAAAEAHTGVGSTMGFGHGFGHPFSGFDHVLAMVAVGLFAANPGGRAMWLVPASFVVMMAVGGTLGIAGFTMPFVEIGIALSVIVLGAAVALNWNLPVTAAMTLAGFFAIFHGHAHGAEMPVDASGLAYGAGFILATALLHIIGIGASLGASVAARNYSRRITQAGGSAMALAGVAILAGWL
ncbi:HupE/UreJ family protein [Taklimakanibacter lacteus]|uniref:HupE/UreJ family protein n=1 Tax=Taklimakanibacter lacteus TaxID=2268456 RepID=UPI000E668C26